MSINDIVSLAENKTDYFKKDVETWTHTRICSLPEKSGRSI